MRLSMITIRTLRRSTLTLILGLLVAGTFSACSPDDPFIPANRPVVVEKKGAWLRVIHAAYDDPAVMVRVGDSLLFDQPQRYLKFDAAVGNEAKYYPIDTSAHSIKFSMGGGGDLAALNNLTFTENAYYTVYFYGKGGTYKALLTNDTIEAPLTTDPKPVKIRVIHLSPDAPALTVRLDSNTATPLVQGVSYEKASDYALNREVPLANGTGLFISEYPSNKEVFVVPAGFRLLSGQTTTVLITGSLRPSGDAPLLRFTTFLESTRSDDSLRGSAFIPIVLGAQRLVNLTNSGDSSVDMTMLETRDQYKPEFEFNNYFRRTQYSGRHFFVDRIASLGKPGYRWTRPYRYEGIFVDQTMTYRIEYFEEWAPQPSSIPTKPPGTPTIDYRRQHVLAEPKSFFFESNKRFTFVAYGQYEPDASKRNTASGRTVVLTDNTPAPPGAMAQVRFFHGAFGPLESKRLRLRVNGATTPTGVAYGEAVNGTNSVAVSTGPVTAEVIDEDGNVVHSQELITDPNSHTGLEPGKSYTVFLSRGADGASLYMQPLSEELLVE